MASESRSSVPASTSAWQRRSYSSAEPSHQYTACGRVSFAISRTHARRRGCDVCAATAIVAAGILTTPTSTFQTCQLRRRSSAESSRSLLITLRDSLFDWNVPRRRGRSASPRTPAADCSCAAPICHWPAGQVSTTPSRAQPRQESRHWPNGQDPTAPAVRMALQRTRRAQCALPAGTVRISGMGRNSTTCMLTSFPACERQDSFGHLRHSRSRVVAAKRRDAPMARTSLSPRP